MRIQAQQLVINSTRKFINTGARSRLWNLLKNFHAADIASLINHLTFSEKLTVFKVIFDNNKEKIAEAVSELDPNDSAELIKELKLDQIIELFHIIPSDDVASILYLLPEETQKHILTAMEKKPSEDVKELLHYEEETAGRIMSTNFYALNQNTKLSDAITAMQLEGDVESAFYLYIVDNENHLVGVTSLKQLLFAKPDTTLTNIMTKDVISVTPETDQEQVARIVADYNLVAVPVIDSERVLIGVVTVDDVIDVIDKEATEDMYKMVSLDTSERIKDNPFKSIKRRLPFLMLSILTASLAPFIVNQFKSTLEAAVILAVFMPLVAALGGIAGNQTIAIMVREIAIGEAAWLTAKKALLKEIIVGIGNGIVIGSLLAGLSYFLIGNPYLGLILGVAIIINLFLAALLGTLIPLLLKLLKLDPALGSVNILTMCTDTIGFAVFLGLGTLFLKYLI
ncbi:MAG: magnesium transporter [Candidatus Aminicenantaceae bacterium]